MTEFELGPNKNKINIRRKKKRWLVETSYLKAEGENKREALSNLAAELKYLAMNIEDLIEKLKDE